MKFVLFLAAFQIQPTLPADSIERIRRTARNAEARFERLLRTLAPLRWGSSPGTQCDEIVGRFCLTYDSEALPTPEPEAPRVRDARREAIEALRLAFSYEADRLATTRPLVRYLVEDDRATEAVSAARTYDALTGDTVWGPLLLGFALHALAEDTAAERLFDLGLSRFDPEERRRIRDLDWIVSVRDRGFYRGLDDEARRRSEARLWRHADPLYLTPGNERRAEHLSRHVWSRILGMTPIVAGMPRWGRDLEELTVRYGVPMARTRTRGVGLREGGLTEHYDPDALAFIQEDLLSRGPAPTPPPGERWGLEHPRARSSFAPRTLRRLIPLPHQVTRFPNEDRTTVRIDGVLELDSLARGAAVARTGLWLLDEFTMTTLDSVAGSVLVRGDSLRFHHEVEALPGGRLYSLEALEEESGLGGRARYALDLEEPPGSAPIVSDPLLARPFGGRLPEGREDPRLAPHGELVLAAGDTVGLYAEALRLRPDAEGIRHFRVDLSVRRADRAAFPARAVAWIGRRLGLGSAPQPPRVVWEDRWEAVEPAIIAIDLPLADLPGGLHAVELSVTDLLTGAETTTRKLVRIRD